MFILLTAKSLYFCNINDSSSEPLFTFSVVTRSNIWSWNNCTRTLNVSEAKSITRASSWRNWRELLLYCPGQLSNTSPYGGLGASWAASFDLRLPFLSVVCLPFVYLLSSRLGALTELYLQYVTLLPVLLLFFCFLSNSFCVSIMEFWNKVAAGC